MLKNKLKYLGPVFWIFAVCFLFLEDIQKPDYSIDLFNQSVVANNIFNGNGVSQRLIIAEDLSKVEYEPDFTFAPGYTLFLASHINKWDYPINLFASVKFVLDLLSLFLVFLVLKKANVTKNDYLLYALMLFLLVSKSLVGGPTDLIALCLVLGAALYFSGKFKSIEDVKFKHVFVIAVLSFLLGFFRYAYYPLTITYSVVFGMLWLIHKDWRWLKWAVINGVLVVLMLLPQLLYQMSKSNHVSSIAENKEHVEKGFHAIHMLYAKPVFTSMFFDNIILFRAMGYEGIGGYDRGYEVPLILRGFLLLVSFAILAFLINQALKLYRSKKEESKQFLKYILLAIGVAAGIKFIFLHAISLYYPSAYPDFIWTHAMIGRYYNIVIIAAILIFFLLLQLSNNGMLKKLVLVLFGVSMAFHFAHKAYLLKNYSLHDANFNTNLRYPPKDFLKDSKSFYKALKNDESEYVAFLYTKKPDIPAERILFAYLALAEVQPFRIKENQMVSSAKNVWVLSNMEAEELSLHTDLVLTSQEMYTEISENGYPIYRYRLELNIDEDDVL